MEKLSVSRHFVLAALGGIRRRGIDVNTVLDAAGISPSLLAHPRARVSGQQYTRLIQTIWQTLRDEYMGFTDSPSKPGTFATMCYLVVHCTHLESVYKRAQAFYGLFDQPVIMALEKDETQAALVMRPETRLHDPDHFLQESLLVIWHRFSCWLTGECLNLEAVHVNYPPPEHAREYRYLFNCPVEFNCPDTRLIFSKRYLTLPVIQDEVHLKEFLKTSPADLLGKPNDRLSFSARIRERLFQAMQHELPDFESIADALNMSPQTLRRRLRDEHVTYQELKDQVRRDLAIYHLARTELTIQDIALRVGFTEPSTFHRAFKIWTGSTPGEYRENLLREKSGDQPAG